MIYYGYIVLIAVDKAFMAQKIGEVTTLGIPLGVLVILLHGDLGALSSIQFNKGDLIEFVAKQTNLPKTQAKNAVEAVLDGIKKNAKRDVRLVGFEQTLQRKIKEAFLAVWISLRWDNHRMVPNLAEAVERNGISRRTLERVRAKMRRMGLIEAGRRGALQVASETTVIDEDGRAVMGSVDTFLRKRTEGTERSDKAAPNKGVEKFWGDMPTWGMYEGEPNIDLVIVLAIDGNFDPTTNELIPFERQFQFLHSLQNYFLTNELLAPGHVMPLVDNDRLRERRAGFVARFCERPFFFIRAATPQVLLDEVDKIL